MTAFASRWLDWHPSHSNEDGTQTENDGVRSTASSTPETSSQGTDKTDRRAFVSFVSASPKRFQPGIGGEAGDGAGAVHGGTREQAGVDDGVLPSGWGDASALVEWFLTTEPPSQSFELCKGVVIANPALWWTALMRDIAEGPNGPRASCGAMQADLRRLAAARRRGKAHGH